MLTSDQMTQIFSEDYPTEDREALIHRLIEERDAALQAGGIVYTALSIAVSGPDFQAAEQKMKTVLYQAKTIPSFQEGGRKTFKALVQKHLDEN